MLNTDRLKNVITTSIKNIKKAWVTNNITQNFKEKTLNGANWSNENPQWSYEEINFYELN